MNKQDFLGSTHNIFAGAMEKAVLAFAEKSYQAGYEQATIDAENGETSKTEFEDVCGLEIRLVNGHRMKMAGVEFTSFGNYELQTMPFFHAAESYNLPSEDEMNTFVKSIRPNGRNEILLPYGQRIACFGSLKFWLDVQPNQDNEGIVLVLSINENGELLHSIENKYIGDTAAVLVVE